MLFSLLKHYLELYITDTALKVSRPLYCFTTSICHGVENYFPRLWGMGSSDANLSIEKLWEIVNCKTPIEHTFSDWVCSVGNALLMLFF